MPKKDIIVSSTDVLQDYIIEEYVEYIDATSTIGSGFLTDFLSGWTDTFGVKSGMIENKIHVIKQEVKRKLIEKAIRLRCNAIIGLSIDVDEISSNQKMIFMVTAAGTAVRCKKKTDDSQSSKITGEYLNRKLYLVEEYKQRLSAFQVIDSASLDTLNTITNEIIQRNLYDLLEDAYICCLLEFCLQLKGSQVFNDDIMEVLNSMNTEVLSRAFLDNTLSMSENKEKILGFRKTGSYETFCKFFSAIMPLSLICDYLQKGNDFFNVIVIFPLLKGFKDYYEKDDTERIDKIIHNLKMEFWDENLCKETLTADSRVCECGKLVMKNTSCDCGSTRTISASTFKDKVSVINQLELIHKELLSIQWE